MSLILTEEALGVILPRSTKKARVIYPPLLNERMPHWGIASYSQQVHFLAQLFHESDSLRATREYASGEKYEGRTDLGNIVKGDGIRFAGRGLIQCTGRTNYKACSLALFEDLRLLEHPELLELPFYAVESACWYWTQPWRKLNEIANYPASWTITVTNKRTGEKETYTKLQWITKLVNGGLNGYSERLAFYNRIIKYYPVP